MKDEHKVHKHRHREEERSHKKCRRKKEKLRNLSHSGSRKRSNSRSDDQSDSQSPDYNRKSPLKSRSRSPDYRKRYENNSESPEIRKTRYSSRSRSPEYRKPKYESRSPSPESRKSKYQRRNRSSSDDSYEAKRSPEHKRKDKEVRVKKEENGHNGRRFKDKYSDQGRGRNSGKGNDDKPRWGKGDDKEEKKPMENKAKPDFGLSGKLAEEVNTYKGVVIKYSQPPEARMPKRRWRLYPFKGDEPLPTLYIHRQSAYLIGRDRVVVDIPIDHPSCSKQHAVLQYRVVPYTKENGMKGNRIRPYIIDLDSANGTFVNNNKIEPRKFVELLEKDVLKFAFSSREYVVLHEHSKDDEEDDNVNMTNED